MKSNGVNVPAPTLFDTADALVLFAVAPNTKGRDGSVVAVEALADVVPLTCTDEVEVAVGTNVGATGGAIPKLIADDAVRAAVLFPGALFPNWNGANVGFAATSVVACELGALLLVEPAPANEKFGTLEPFDGAVVLSRTLLALVLFVVLVAPNANVGAAVDGADSTAAVVVLVLSLPPELEVPNTNGVAGGAFDVPAEVVTVPPKVKPPAFEVAAGAGDVVAAAVVAPKVKPPEFVEVPVSAGASDVAVVAPKVKPPVFEMTTGAGDVVVVAPKVKPPVVVTAMAVDDDDPNGTSDDAAVEVTAALLLGSRGFSQAGHTALSLSTIIEHLEHFHLSLYRSANILPHPFVGSAFVTMSGAVAPAVALLLLSSSSSVVNFVRVLLFSCSSCNF